MQKQGMDALKRMAQMAKNRLRSKVTESEDKMIRSKGHFRVIYGDSIDIRNKIITREDKILYEKVKNIVDEELDVANPIAKNVFVGIKLKDKDKVVYADESNNGNLLLVAHSGMAVNVLDDTPITGRTTAGVKAMALDDNDKIVAVNNVKKSGAITVLTSRGYVKNVSIGEYETTARNRKGLRITGKDTGNVKFISFGVVPPNIAIIQDGKVVLIKSKYIPYDNRAGKGKQILKDEFKNAFEPLN